MIAAWMIYAIMVSAAVALAALAAERRTGRRTGVWLAGTVGGLVLPAVALIQGSGAGAAPLVSVVLPAVWVTPNGALPPIGAPSLNAALIGVWALTSLVLLATLGHAVLRLGREAAAGVSHREAARRPLKATQTRRFGTRGDRGEPDR